MCGRWVGTPLFKDILLLEAHAGALLHRGMPLLQPHSGAPNETEEGWPKLGARAGAGLLCSASARLRSASCRFCSMRSRKLGVSCGDLSAAAAEPGGASGPIMLKVAV